MKQKRVKGDLHPRTVRERSLTFKTLGLLAVVALIATSTTFMLPIPIDNILPQTGPQKGERLVGAYYYVWYTEGWKVEDDTPLLGYYSSDNNSVIRVHLELAAMAAIDFLAISWSDNLKWHEGKTALVCDKVFNIDDEMGSPVKLAIMIEYWHGEFLNLSESANTIYARYASKPSYFKLYGKPLLFVYTLDDYSPPKWNDSRFTVRYVPLEVPYGKDTFLERSIQNRTTYEFTGVSPHRDNLHIDRDRANGYHYSEIWNHAIQFGELAAEKPVVVMIGTFNEWWESTSIEPSVNYGFQYLDLTRNFIVKFKHKTSS